MLAASCAAAGGYQSTLLRWDNLHNQPGFEAYVTRFIAAYTDMESKKARCFRKTYVGVKAPIPPFSPFPMRIRVR